MLLVSYAILIILSGHEMFLILIVLSIIRFTVTNSEGKLNSYSFFQLKWKHVRLQALALQTTS